MAMVDQRANFILPSTIHSHCILCFSALAIMLISVIWTAFLKGNDAREAELVVRTSRDSKPSSLPPRYAELSHSFARPMRVFAAYESPVRSFRNASAQIDGFEASVVP